MNASLFPVLIILASWIAFAVVWAVSALNAKRYVRRNTGSWMIRIAIVIVLFVVFNIHPVENYFAHVEADLAAMPPVEWLGAFLCACGVSIAIWARMHLGANWGMPMSLKQDAELVTTGPYMYVRHPIYSGMTLAMLGSSLVSVWWFAAFISFFIYFVFSAKTEEEIMLKEFPNQYPDYMKRTKMLIPFVF